MSAPTPRACAVRDDDSESMELQAFRNQGADQSTSVVGNTFSSDDATEPSGETLPRTLMDESRPLLARIEHVDSEQPTQQPSTNTLPLNSPAGVWKTNSRDESRPSFLDRDYVKTWFPSIDPEHPKFKARRRTDRDRALLCQLLLAIIVLCINVGVTVYSTGRYGHDDGFGTLYTGTCSDTALINSALHLGLNALSTLLLISSNYCAQVLSSPTRTEVDRAHKEHDWLDIGVPSVRNLLKDRIQWRRRIAWGLLLSSSALLHLTWNSAVFVTLPRNNYHIAVVTSDFRVDSALLPTNALQVQDLYEWARNDSLEHLSNAECVQRYTDSTIALTDVIVVADNVTMDMGLSLMNVSNHGPQGLDSRHSSLLWEDVNRSGADAWVYGAFWVCSDLAGLFTSTWCTAKSLENSTSNWTVGFSSYHDWDITRPNTTTSKVPVQYCLSAGSRAWGRECSVRYSLGILIIVCLLNALKVITIAYTWFWSRHAAVPNKPSVVLGMKNLQPSLVTIGDAVASFLSIRDDSTASLVLAGKKDVVRAWPSSTAASIVAARYTRLRRTQRWYQAVSIRRWGMALATCIATLAVVAALLALGATTQRGYGIDTSLGALIRAGLATVQPYGTTLTTLLNVTFNRSLRFWAAVLIANAPQLLLSILYLFLNGLLAAMHAAYEWSSYISERKTLRLSSPHGIQRGTYFLTIPYRFALPLQLFSAALHWLISQSLFVIDVGGLTYKGARYGTGSQAQYDPNGKMSTTMIGYSLLGITCALTVGSTLVVWIVWTGSFKMESERVQAIDGELGSDQGLLHMPMVSTCSAAISAACHPPPEDNAADQLPIIWGRIPGSEQWAFTSAREVKLSLLS